jgi:hypothetical protein
MDIFKPFVDIAPQLTQPLVLMGFVFLLVFGIHKALIKSDILTHINPGAGGTVVIMLIRYSFWLAVLVIVLGYGLKAYDIHHNGQSTHNHYSATEAGIPITQLKYNSRIQLDDKKLETPPVLDYRFDRVNDEPNIYNDSDFVTKTGNTKLGKGYRGKGTSPTPGKRGTSLYFDGTTNAYVKVSAYPTALKKVDTNFSVEATAWFDNNAALHNAPIVSDKNRYKTPGGFLLGVRQKKLTFIITSTTNHTERAGIKSKSILIPDTWYHFVATFDHGIIKLYINSKLDDQKIAMFNRTSFQSGKPLYLGTSQIQKAYLHGRLDEVRIYNYTLSSKAISNRFNRIF